MGGYSQFANQRRTTQPVTAANPADAAALAKWMQGYNFNQPGGTTAVQPGTVAPNGLAVLPGGMPFGYNQLDSVLKGHLPTSYTDMGGLGGAQQGLITDPSGKFAQQYQNVDLGPLGSFINPLQQAGLSAFQQANGPGFNPNAALGNLAGNFSFAQNQIDSVSGDPTAYANSRLDLLRQQAAPYENQAFNRLQDTLFSQGRAGSTGGGLMMREFANGLGQADLQRQQQAWDFANQTKQSTINSALQRFGLAQTLFDSRMGGNQALYNQGLGALAGFGQIQNYGLNNLNANLVQAQARAAPEVSLRQVNAQGGNGFNQALAGGSALGSLLAGGGAAWSAFSGPAAVAAPAAAASDPRLKEEVEATGKTAGGFPVYRWKWNERAKAIGLTGPAEGVMATDVVQTRPELISWKDGYLAVDYAALEAA